MKQILPSILVLFLLASCGHYSGFNQQQYTKLRPLKSNQIQENSAFEKTYCQMDRNTNQEFSSPYADTIKMKDSTIIVGDIYSKSPDRPLIKGKLGFKYLETNEPGQVVYENVDTIIFDNKFQLGKYEYTIDPEITNELKARRKRKGHILILVAAILFVPISVVVWAALILVFAFVWGLIWLIVALFGATLSWPDNSIFLAPLYYALAAGAGLSIIFALLYLIIRNWKGIIDKKKRVEPV